MSPAMSKTSSCGRRPERNGFRSTRCSLPGPDSDGRPLLVGSDALTSTSGGIFVGSSQSCAMEAKSAVIRLRIACR
jgi:hypothetical protein